MLQRFAFPRMVAFASLMVCALPAFPNSTVSAPSEISVYFTEALEPKFSSLQLTDEKGTVLSKVPSVMDPADHKHLTLAVPSLNPGVYYVQWSYL